MSLSELSSLEFAYSPAKTERLLSVTLTPVQQPEARLETTKSVWARPDRRMQSTSRQAKDPLKFGSHPELMPHLRLGPGEPSQLWVQVHNHCRTQWTFRLAVSPSIPKAWCEREQQNSEPRYYDLRGRDEPNRDLETDDVSTTVELPFTVPKDFFERHAAIQDRQPLKIDYDGFIQVYARRQGSADSEQLMAAAPFKAVVRSPSRYLNYLPQVYQEVDFIGRLLKIFEQSFDPSVETLKLLWAYLDPRTSPEALLPFLAHWVGWPTTDALWEHALQRQPQRLRQLIFNAMELYRWRGTAKGLTAYLHLYTGLPKEAIWIKNGVDTGFEIGKAYLYTGLPREDLWRSNSLDTGFETDKSRLNRATAAVASQPKNYHFRVRLRPPSPEHEESLKEQKDLIHTIIRQEKPAFCTYDLRIEKFTTAPNAS